MLTTEDFRYAMRGIVKKPKFSALTIFIMTMGLSLFIFMLSFLHNTLQAPLDFPNGDRFRFLSTDGNWDSIRIHDFEDIKASQQSFETLDYFSTRSLRIRTENFSTAEFSLLVTAKFFELTRVKAIKGRILTSSDYAPSAEPVTLINEVLWDSMFARDPNLLGKYIDIDGTPHAIVGVLAKEFQFPFNAKLYAPNLRTTKGVARANGLTVLGYGVLKEGVSDARANKDISSIVKDIKAQYPKLFKKNKVEVVTFQEQQLRIDLDLIFPMQICVIIILLLCLINTGNLLLSRAMEKGKETAIRAALGAPKVTLIMQTILESLIICTISFFLSLLISNQVLKTSLDILTLSYPQAQAPFWWKFHITSSAIMICFIFSLVVAVIMGLLPSLMSVGGNINQVLRSGTRGAQSRFSGMFGKLVIIAEIALSTALLIPSIMIVWSVYDDSNTDYGASTEGYYATTLTFRHSNYTTQEQKRDYHRKLSSTLLEDPQIEQASFTNSLPVFSAYYAGVALEGVDYGSDPEHKKSGLLNVDHNYFDALDIELKKGRLFNDGDRENTPYVAVVTEGFARSYGIEDPLDGTRFKLSKTADFYNYDLDENRVYTIVGVVNDVIQGIGSEDIANVYISNIQDPFIWGYYVVRTKMGLSALETKFKEIAYKVDPSIIPIRFNRIERYVERSLAYPRFLATIFSVFALVAMVIAFGGIYGVMSNSVVQKNLEIGVYRAVGADKFDIYKLFFKKASAELLMGVLIGLPSGYALFQFVGESFSSSFADFGLVAALVFLITLVLVTVAVIVPVTKSVRLEPNESLRLD